MSYSDNEIVRVGSVGVDSGQVMVGDPCYLDDFKTHSQCDRDGGLHLEAGDCKPPYAYSYEGASQATCSPEMFGQLGDYHNAVAVSSGYGDGVYPVYVEKNREGRVVALHVYFDEDPNEERRYCPDCGSSQPDEHFCESCGECDCVCGEDDEE